MAYASLGASYGNLNQPSLARDNFRKAYELRDRVTQQERFFIEALYYSYVTGEIDKAIQTYTEWARTYSAITFPMVTWETVTACSDNTRRQPKKPTQASALNPTTRLPMGILPTIILL